MRRSLLVVISLLALAACSSSKHDKTPAITTYDNGAISIAPIAPGDEPRVSEDAARAIIGNSTAWQYSAQPGSLPAEPGSLTLARITTTSSSKLVQPWNNRLAWFTDNPIAVLDLGSCPKPAAPAASAPTSPDGLQHHIIAVDASGVGDGLAYVGQGINCGKPTPVLTLALARAWSATWKQISAAPRKVTLSYTSPPCGSLLSEQGVSATPFQWAVLFTVPYGKTGCAAPTSGISTVTANPKDPKATVPKVGEPLYGWVRIVDGTLVIPLKY